MLQIRTTLSTIMMTQWKNPTFWNFVLCIYKVTIMQYILRYMLNIKYRSYPPRYSIMYIQMLKLWNLKYLIQSSIRKMHYVLHRWSHLACALVQRDSCGPWLQMVWQQNNDTKGKSSLWWCEQGSLKGLWEMYAMTRWCSCGSCVVLG